METGTVSLREVSVTGAGYFSSRRSWWLSFMTVDRLSKQFCQISAFAQCNTELDMCVVGRGVHGSDSKKQHLLKAAILTCPQGS